MNFLCYNWKKEKCLLLEERLCYFYNIGKFLKLKFLKGIGKHPGAFHTDIFRRILVQQNSRK